MVSSEIKISVRLIYMHSENIPFCEMIHPQLQAKQKWAKNSPSAELFNETRLMAASETMPPSNP